MEEAADELADAEKASKVSEYMRRFRAALDKRLRNFRHKHVAHATLLTVDERAKGEIEHPHAEDADWVVERTIAVMTEFSSLARGEHFADQRENQQRARHNAESYFAAMGPALVAASRVPL